MRPVAGRDDRGDHPWDVATVARVVAADRHLTRRLYGLAAEVETGNVVFSPYGIATAFSMAEVGAASETERQLRAALGFDGPDADRHAGRQALDAAVGTTVDVPEGASGLTLEIANAPFVQPGFSLVAEFVRVLAGHYGAEPTPVDFVADPDRARQAINAWVADHTGDRITDLLPDGSIDALARLVLVNTVFFHGQWRTPFPPERTVPGPFTRLDGTIVEVDLMNGASPTTYDEGDGWQMVRLPYWGGASMTVVLPAPGRFDEITDRVATGLLDEIAELRRQRLVSLTLPRFAFATPTDLIERFRALGVVDAFDPRRADFSNLSTDTPLHISGAFHQATIEVDEFGTTATAATALVMSRTSAPEPAEFRADRPFLFVVEHDATGEPLFIGRVLDPTA